MNRFEQIRQWYQIRKPDGSRLWSEKMLRDAVEKGWLTRQQYEQLVAVK